MHPKVFVIHILFIFCIKQSIAQRLNGYQIDPSKVTTSGVSSGGSVASQFHIAFSSKISGVGIIGGPPYYCAVGSLTTAMVTCMTSLIGPTLTTLTSKLESFASSNLIDDISNLKNDRVYVFSGTKDTTVKPSIVKLNQDLYAKYTNANNIKSVYSYDSANGMITENYGSACSGSNIYHMYNCDYNQAYDILNHLYPNDNIQKPVKDTQPLGTLQKFDQSEFFSSSLTLSLSDTGYVYVPSSCLATQCKLHVVFHGCNQQADKIDDIFVKNAGFNQVADFNNIIILYPQAKTSMTNPNGCFDWWGYTNKDYANKNGLQLKAVMAMVDRLRQEQGIIITVPTSATTQPTAIVTGEQTTKAPTQATTSTATTGAATTRVPSQNILDSFDIDTTKITTSGISSGASMATQLHIAFSSIISGTGIVAGGPYYCATGTVMSALTTCMSSTTGPSAATLTNKIDTYNKNGDIDNVSNLRNHRVYIYSGSKDTVVKTGVVKVNEQVYSKYVSAGSIKAVYSYASVHGMITNSYGSACGVQGQYYINNCDYDQAYDILNHVYPNDDIKQPVKNTKYTGVLHEFSQTQFFPAGSASKISMDATGYLYVPTSCLTKRCKLHIALHGCVQQKEKIGNVFAANSGYNQVADLNDIVVLYPQAKASSSQNNPNGCWDWWGYADANYATKNGVQMKAIRAMIQRIANI